MPKASKFRTVVVDHSKKRGEVKAIGGSMDDDFNNVLARQAIDAQWYHVNDPKEGHDQIVGQALAFMLHSKPADEIEGMLLTQMLAMHAAAMECSRRAMIPQQMPQHRDQNLNAATKASRTFLMQVEALQRYRGKGTEQRVTVQHQHINLTADQAVVGITALSDQGTGAALENGGQAYALGHATSPTLRSEDATRNALPIASGEG
jgi:hypothetical protein